MANTDISLPVIYKQGIILFRNLLSLLRVLPSWKFYKWLKRKVGRIGHLYSTASPGHGYGQKYGFSESYHFEAPISVFSTAPICTDFYILFSDKRRSPTQRLPLTTSTHAFPPVPHLGSFILHTTYLTTLHFQLDETGIPPLFPFYLAQSGGVRSDATSSL